MKFYLITTHHNRHTRHDYIREHLSEVGIDYTPILAPDWKMFVHTALNPKQYKHQSLTLAYYQIAQTAVFEGLNEYVVLEDDVQLLPMGKESMKEMNAGNYSIYEDVDLMFLTKTDHNQASIVKPISEAYSEVLGNWWETPITLWSKRFAEAYIAWIENKLTEGLWLGHIDHELNKMNETGNYLFLGYNYKTAVGLSSERSYAEGKNITFEGSIVNDIM